MSDIYFLLTGYAKIFPFPLFHKISIAGPGIWYLHDCAAVWQHYLHTTILNR